MEYNLPEDKLSETGLDAYSPGDTVFAPVKISITGDEQGQVTGFKVDAIGQISDKSKTSFTDIAAPTEPESDEPEPDMANGEEVPPTPEGDDSDDEDDGSESDMLGYNRPKTPKAKMPKASELFDN